MLNAFRTRLEVAVGNTRVVAHRSGSTSGELAKAALADPSIEQIVVGFEQVLAAVPHRRPLVRVALDDALCRLFMVTPPGNAQTLADLKAATAMRFKSLYDMPAAEWRIEADWRGTEPFLACALPQSLLTGLVQAAAKRRAALVEIAPNFVLAWNDRHAELKAGAWFGVVQNGALTLAPVGTPGVQGIRSLPADMCPDTSTLVRHVQREALRMGIAAPTCVQLCGDRSVEWAAGTVDGIEVQWLDRQAERSGRSLKLQRGGAS